MVISSPYHFPEKSPSRIGTVLDKDAQEKRKSPAVFFYTQEKIIFSLTFNREEN
jgi:hypothetical protein